MERRNFVKTLSAAAAVAAIPPILAKAARAEDHSKHKGMKTTGAGKTEFPAALKDLARKAGDCVAAGEVCTGHCNSLLAQGETAMAECQSAVLNMLASCRALASLAAYHSANEASLKAMAKVCAELCRACEKACEKHAEHHAECKACMESCQACAKACETYAS